MMYNNKFAVSVKVDGKVVRERGDVVYVPFGSEYTVLLTNLNNIRASASITIDGTDIGNGSTFIVGANDSVEIKRFLGSDNTSGNALKFIERTSKIEDHRGITPADGILRVEVWFERPPTQIKSKIWDELILNTYDSNNTTKYTLRSLQQGNDSYSIQSCSAQAVGDVGITVPGSIVEQQFNTVRFDSELASTVLVLQMLGTSENTTFTRTKVTCPTCGTKNKSKHKCCTECGTSLV